jgi:endo-alpha-1,4-polygalactosaminidase (GH114 family)
MLRLLLGLLVSVLTACGHTTTAFRLYYGHDPSVLDQLLHNASSAVLVVDSRALLAQQEHTFLHRAQAQSAITLGYISIGELEQKERLRAERLVGPLDAALLNWNEKFSSWRVDVSHPAWQRWIRAELARIQNAGYTGFFLDTPDTVDNYITHTNWSRAQRGEKVRAMVSLIRAIKAEYPQQFVLLNRGLNLVSDKIWMDEKGLDTELGLGLFIPHPHNPDAILYENAFASHDPWTQRIESDLTATARAGRTQVFVLGYADTFGDRDAFFERAKQSEFVAAWANSSTDLHEHPTHSP